MLHCDLLLVLVVWLTRRQDSGGAVAVMFRVGVGGRCRDACVESEGRLDDEGESSAGEDEGSHRAIGFTVQRNSNEQAKGST